MEDLSTVTATSKANVFWSPAVAIPEFDSVSFGGKQKETNNRGVGNVERERERERDRRPCYKSQDPNLNLLRNSPLQHFPGKELLVPRKSQKHWREKGAKMAPLLPSLGREVLRSFLVLQTKPGSKAQVFPCSKEGLSKVFLKVSDESLQATQPVITLLL